MCLSCSKRGKKCSGILAQFIQSGRRTPKRGGPGQVPPVCLVITTLCSCGDLKKREVIGHETTMLTAVLKHVNIF